MFKSAQSNWAPKTISYLGTIATVAIFSRHDHQSRFPIIRNWSRDLRHSDLPDAPNEGLVKLVEDDLFLISSKKKTPIVKAAEFAIMVGDNLESQTFGAFYYNRNALFCLSARLAIEDVQTIRQQYPNFLNLFREIFAESEKVETAHLSDADLQKVILSKNAKKFAIARELLYADSPFLMIPLAIIAGPTFLAYLFCKYAKNVIGSAQSFIIALIFATIIILFLLKYYYKYEVLSLDESAAKIDEDHKIGCREYLESTIELGKLIHQLTCSNKNRHFNEQGNCLDHSVIYTKRLKWAERRWK